MKKLLVLTNFWPTEDNPISGIFVSQQSGAFATLGCSVRVGHVRNYVHRWSRRLSAVELGCREVEVDSLNVFTLPENFSGFPGVLDINTALIGLAVSRLIMKHKAEGWCPDYVLVHGIRYVGLSAPYWKAAVDAPIAQVIHGIDPQLKGGKRAGDVQKRIRKSSTFHDITIAVGSPLLNHTNQLGLENIKVVYNGTLIPPENLHPYPQRLISPKRSVLSVSNLVELKGVDLNLRALRNIRFANPDIDWEYRIVGDGPERARLVNLAEELGIASRVIFLGRLSYADTMREMGDCDVFCLPSWAEAFGIVYLEAMARCRAVIGCWRNGAEDIISHEVDGLLVEPRDLQSLTTALTKLLAEPDTCAILGRNARTKAVQYSWESNAKQILDLFAGCHFEKGR